jgi:hypothetical protein
MRIPNYIQDLTFDAVVYLQEQGYKVELPELKIRHPSRRHDTSGVCYKNHINLNLGTDRTDTKLVLLHELAHWAFPTNSGHEGHTDKFWALAWKLYKYFKLPIRYCLKRERNYRSGALVAYRKLNK